LAQPIGGANLPRPWSRHSEGSSAFVAPKSIDEDPTTSMKANGGVSKLHVSKKKNTSSEVENDPQLQEFLEVMQPRSKSKIWGNDTMLASGLETKVPKKEKKNRDRDASKSKASVEVKTVESFSRRVPINKGKGSEKLTQMHVRFEGSDSEGSSDDELYEEAPVLDTVRKEEVNAGGLDDISSLQITPEDPLLKDETVTDLDYFKSRTKSGDWSDEDEEEAKKDEAELENASSEEEDEEEDEDEDEDEGEGEDDEEDREVGSEDNAMVIDKDTDVILAETERDDTERNIHHDKDVEEQKSGGAVVAVEEQESVSDTGRLFVRNLPYTAT
jgi:multiple RNA-binding domain-containing protein 1